MKGRETPLKTHKCSLPSCDNDYIKYDSMNPYCSGKCKAKNALIKFEKQVKRKKKENRRQNVAYKKEFLKTDKRHQTKLTQVVFNRWCRLRDEGMPCISCGISYGQRHAGHYRSRGAAPELRFEPLNCHVQCAQCNSSKSGNVVEYRIGLIKKIGIEKVEWLEGPHEPKKYTCEDLIALRAKYAKLIREATQ